MLKTLKKIFLPSVTDEEVKAIQKDGRRMLEETSRTAKRHKALLDKNGFTMRIYIATGGDHRNVH